MGAPLVEEPLFAGKEASLPSLTAGPGGPSAPGRAGPLQAVSARLAAKPIVQHDPRRMGKKLRNFPDADND
jgi:hypothetical protein